MVTTGTDAAPRRRPAIAGVHELAYPLLRDRPWVVSAGIATRVGTFVPLAIRGGLRSTPRMSRRSVGSPNLVLLPPVCVGGPSSRWA